MKTFCLLFCLFCCSNTLAKWSIEKPFKDIPKEPIQGMVMGNIFELGTASFSESGLKFESQEKYGDFWHTATITIMGIQQAGYWELVPSKVSLGTPWVHTDYFIKGANGPQYSPMSLTFQGDYSMKLIIEKEGESHKGSIHLSLPDYRHSFLVGEFTINQ